MEYTIETIIQIHLVIISFAIPVLIAWIRKKTMCLDKIDKRSFRQSQALLVLSQEIDKQTNKAHPGTESELAERVETILKDEEGKL